MTRRKRPKNKARIENKPTGVTTEGAEAVLKIVAKGITDPDDIVKEMMKEHDLDYDPYWDNFVAAALLECAQRGWIKGKATSIREKGATTHSFGGDAV